MIFSLLIFTSLAQTSQAEKPSSQPAARSIVYLVSDAASMAAVMGSTRQKLIESIKGLHDPAIPFDVIFCHDGKQQSCFDGKPALATGANVKIALAFIDKDKPVGKADPLGGVAAAVAEKPGMIYFLFNGIDPAVKSQQLVDAFANANPDPDHPVTRVRTILMMGSKDEPLSDELTDALAEINKTNKPAAVHRVEAAPEAQPLSQVFVCSDAAVSEAAIGFLKSQLKTSVKAIPVEAKKPSTFDVIFCHDGKKQSCFDGKLKPATDASIKTALAFIDRLKPSGKCDPLAGIATACAEKPERIYLLLQPLDPSVSPKKLVDAFAKLNANPKLPATEIYIIYISDDPASDELKDAMSKITDAGRIRRIVNSDAQDK